jgi:hypothetical protein
MNCDDVEARIPAHLLDEHDRLRAIGRRVDGELVDFLGRCEALRAELDTRLHPRLGEREGYAENVDDDVLERVFWELDAIASAMLRRLRSNSIADELTKAWVFDAYGLGGPGIDDADAPTYDKLKDYARARVGTDPQALAQEVSRLIEASDETDRAMKLGARALDIP